MCSGVVYVRGVGSLSIVPSVLGEDRVYSYSISIFDLNEMIVFDKTTEWRIITS